MSFCLTNININSDFLTFSPSLSAAWRGLAEWREAWTPQWWPWWWPTRVILTSHMSHVTTHRYYPDTCHHSHLLCREPGRACPPAGAPWAGRWASCTWPPTWTRSCCCPDILEDDGETGVADGDGDGGMVVGGCWFAEWRHGLSICQWWNSTSLTLFLGYRVSQYLLLLCNDTSRWFCNIVNKEKNPFFFSRS